MFLKSISISCDEGKDQTITFDMESKVQVIKGNGREKLLPLLQWNLGYLDDTSHYLPHGELTVTTKWINFKKDNCREAIIERSRNASVNSSLSSYPKIRVIGIEDLTIEMKNSPKFISEDMYEAYKEIFHVFAGGSVECEKFEDEYRIHEFHFPMKKPRILSELSGGEKTQHGISLLSGCAVDEGVEVLVFDECDAPLDTDLHGRFLGVLKFLKEKCSQILVVSNSSHFDGCDDYPSYELIS